MMVYTTDYGARVDQNAYQSFEKSSSNAFAGAIKVLV